MRLGQTQKLWDHWFFIGAWGYSPAAIDSRNRFAYISDLVDVFVSNSWKNKVSKEKGKINLHVYIHDLYNLHVTISPDYLSWLLLFLNISHTSSRFFHYWLWASILTLCFLSIFILLILINLCFLSILVMWILLMFVNLYPL